MIYAGREVDGFCVQCIVGDREWAIANLGGIWHDASDKVGIGWVWDELYGWQPPEEPEPEIVEE